MVVDVDGIRASADALFSRDGGLHPPSHVVLSWPRPNYIDPETHNMTGPVFLITVVFLTITVYLARMWARVVVAKNHGLDDLLMSIAMIPLLGLTVAVLLGNYNRGTWSHHQLTLLRCPIIRIPMACVGPDSADVGHITTSEQPVLSEERGID